MSEVTRLLDKHQAGDLTRDELLHRLAALTYTAPDLGPRWEDPRSVDWVSGFPQEGTWEELDSAVSHKTLTRDEVDVVHRLYDQLHPGTV